MAEVKTEDRVFWWNGAVILKDCEYKVVNNTMVVSPSQKEKKEVTLGIR